MWRRGADTLAASRGCAGPSSRRRRWRWKDRCGGLRWIALAPHFPRQPMCARHGDEGGGVVFERVVEGATGVAVEGTFADVTDDADNLHGQFWLGTFEVDAHANGIESDEIFVGQRMVNDDDVRMCRVLVEIGEVTALEQAGCKRFEIAAGDGTNGDFVVPFWMLVTEDDKPARAIAVADREPGGEGRRR